MRKERLLIRLEGEVARILDELVRRGYFKNKSEAIRAGIIRLGQEFNILRPPQFYWKELEAELARIGKKMSPEEVLEAIEELEA